MAAPVGADGAALFAGRFEPRRLIGRGASGRVDAAWDHHGSLWVALKRFDPEPGGSDEPTDVEDSFGREVRALRQLDHPDIVRVLAAGRDPQGSPWLAMSLAAGADLSRYTVPSRRLPLPVALRIAERIAAVLAYAHRCGVIHRDLKPANVRIDWAHDRLTVLDFGLARSADGAATRTGRVMGSPSYMAPELLAGAPATPASDLYALGASLFHLLTGRPPHEADTLGALLHRVATAPAPDLRSLLPQASAPLAALTAGLLAAAPSARPADASAVAAAIGHERQALG
jgi:eukaryotic-like serine/threonine-protein kinase